MVIKKRLIRLLPLAILVILFGLFFYFKLYQYITFATLKSYHHTLHDWTQQHYLYMVLAFMGLYIVIVATSVPGATIMTLTGGLLFGIVAGTGYVIVSATIGATLIFLAVRLGLSHFLTKKVDGTLVKLETGFKRNAFNYLLFLRLVPVFPFWLVNIVPALLAVRTQVFVLATFIGIIPGSLVYVMVGNSLNEVFASDQLPDLTIIYKPAILLPLIGLAILALVPVVYKKIISHLNDKKGPYSKKY